MMVAMCIQVDIISYINTITSNTFSDWLRCHNDIFYCNASEDSTLGGNDDNSVLISSHILKSLYNDKIPTINKYYLMLTIEEHLDIFIKTESGAINMVQLLISDFRKRLMMKWDQMYMCQNLTLISSITIHYNLPLSNISQCQSLTESLINLLMEITTKDNNMQSWATLKHIALCTLLHLESCYPTILSQKKSIFADLLQKEKSVYFEILLQLYSLIFKNDVVNKCRLQQENARIISSNLQNVNTMLYDKQEISKFLSWMSNEDSHEKLIGSQTAICKSLLNMIQDASSFLTPLGINRVAFNVLTVSCFISQHTGFLWKPFYTRYIKTSDINILEIFMLLKTLSKSGLLRTTLFEDERLQETLFSIMNNSLSALSRRLVAAHWLTVYPYSKQESSYPIEVQHLNTYCTILEPELTRNIFLKSFDGIELKYFKLILMSIVIKTNKTSDCNSVLLFSSLTELIRNVSYYEPGIFSNILLRVMFAMHIRHCDSIIINDFENVFNNLVNKHPSILPSIVTYLTALDQMNLDENVSPFSSRCLSQIAKLSNDKLTSNLSQFNIDIVKIHIHVLNCVIKMSDLDLKDYLDVIIDLISSWKTDLNLQWLEEACALILELCFNIIKHCGTSNYYRELTMILNEIRFEVLNSMEVKANFLYSLIVSVSCKKVMELLKSKIFSDLNEKDFNLISESMVENNFNSNLILKRNPKSFTNEQSVYESDGDISKYFDFVSSKQFPVVFTSQLQPKNCSDLWNNLLYGIEIEFEIILSGNSVKPWNVEFIQSVGQNSCLIENELEILLSKAESLSIRGRMSATKLDGIFSFYEIETELIELFELALKAPIIFPCPDHKESFVKDLINEKLNNYSFISIDFQSATKYNIFQNNFQDFLFVEIEHHNIFIMFLPPLNHIILKESFISDFCRRFDIYTDLNMTDLISIEEFLKSFE